MAFYSPEIVTRVILSFLVLGALCIFVAYVQVSRRGH